MYSLYVNRFKQLSIKTELIEDCLKPRDDIVARIQFSLIEFYKSLEIYEIYGSKAVDYVAGLATRYALWTLPEYCRYSDLDATEAYALWLSLVWLIDGVFDKFKSYQHIEQEQKRIIKIINMAIDGEKQADKNEEESHLLFNALAKATYLAYTRYLHLIHEYRRQSPEIFSQITYWLMQYLNTLILTPTVDNLKSYYDWRLLDGCMMCVVWHLALFLRIKDHTIKELHMSMFHLVSIIVSYHNDIISYYRDNHQGIPNLINYFHQKNKMLSVIEAINLINSLYLDLADKFYELSNKYPNDISSIAQLCLGIVEGSHNWCNQEERYAKGVEMLKSIENDELQIFDIDDSIVAGDTTY